MLTEFVTRLLDRFRKPPTQQIFAERLMAALRAAGDTRAWIYESEKNRLVQPDAPSNVVNLHNLFREYAGAKPADRHATLKHQASAVVGHAIPARLADAKAQLRPVIRSTSERGEIHLQMATRPELAFRPLCGNLEIGIAYDSEFSVSRLTTTKLQEWGITFDEAYDIAIDNLRAESSRPWLALQNGVFLAQFGDYYDASRLLLTDLLYRQPIAGAPVVMAPNRAVLLLTGDRNPAGFDTMLQVAERAFAQPRPLPPLMLRWDGAAWQRFVPEGFATRLQQLWVSDLAGDYRDQQALMDEAHARDGLDVFVAQYSAYRRPSGELFSMSVWTEGVHSLLPDTDSVMLFRPRTQQSATVPMAELLRLCGDLMTATAHRPVRYEVKAFPDEARFRALMEKYPKP
ncbi:hypothetical protein WM03_14630 [Burkholderia ubonensis]|uniref:DUF1444 family protein n=1 Tax=Burkholderia ubonensis TaxID=101571 RepID=UPI00075DBAF2|nr:DUF1444 family protein [Burkholderia ubonensis]KVN69461.1 hypothetical protein WJ65_08550 [Burkholderia ubonensis]KWI15336.1 hypothetical protein WM02_11710 [Burkholderia ubonensis]KWI29372.1 hypothetical protein WM03_14630 [Burkholderia ubonensis]ODQ38977.1 hypothetical protein BGV63_14200 [Burkholderia ubonensis]OJA24642.1 hypothetical protein BGV58_24750 [Burkholderia ubonensis]